MLVSCLVDADFLDTERFYNRIEFKSDANLRAKAYPSLIKLREKLDQHLAQFKPNNDVNQLRADVLNHVRTRSKLEPGLFSLTVPTWWWKNLNSLALALGPAYT